MKQLIDIIKHGLNDEHQKVRTITALALAALAESSAPYGIEAFDPVLRPLWKGITEYKGKNLASFLKAIGTALLWAIPATICGPLFYHLHYFFSYLTLFKY